jgi:hypothetical protein
MDFGLFKLIFVAIALLFLVFYWIFSFIVLYHLARFGIGTQPKKFAVVFLLGSVTLFFASVMFAANLDWDGLEKQLQRINLVEKLFNITKSK